MKNLKKIRIERNLTQLDLSYMTGLTIATISRLENNDHEARAFTKRKLAECLKVEINDFYRD